MTTHQMAATGSSGPIRAIFLGGTVAGLLDAVNGVVFNFFAHGMGPIQVLQYIGSGFFGKASFDMGLTSAIVGLLSHFFISCVLAAIFFGAMEAIPFIRRFPLQVGAAYGIAVFFTMNFIVLPFTNVVHADVTTAFLVNGVIGHALLVGLPIAAFVSRAKL